MTSILLHSAGYCNRCPACGTFVCTVATEAPYYRQVVSTQACEVKGQDHAEGQLSVVSLAAFGEPDYALRLCPLHLEKWKEAKERMSQLENPESILVIKVEWMDFFRHLNQEQGGGAYPS